MRLKKTRFCLECAVNTDCKNASKPACDTKSNTCKSAFITTNYSFELFKINRYHSE